MFNHLFNTYEAVTPPPLPKFTNNEVINNDTDITDILNFIPVYSLQRVERPVDKISEAPQSEVNDSVQNSAQDIVQEPVMPIQEPSSNPLISNQDIKKPATSKGEFNDRNEFVRTLNAGYRQALSKAGLNPDYSYILTAQAAMESGWGKHVSGDFNFGGIKAVGNQKGTYKSTKEYDKSRGYYTIKDKFRDFDSIDDYCEARVKLLSNKRYNVFNQYDANNPQGIVTHMLKKGYGTAPIEVYVPSVMKIYNTILNILAS